MPPFFPQSLQDDIPACSTIPSGTDVSCSAAPQQGVSADRHSHIRESEDRLDALIADLDRKSVQAERDGDPHGCRLYVDQMTAAIKSRSPEHQARRYEDLERRINEGADFFAWQGRLAAELLAQAGAAKT